MNNKERSKLDIVSADSVIIEDSPVIEVEAEQIELSHGGGLSVIIKHDYYANDTAHGRQLLKAFLTALDSRKADIVRLLVAGSGVRLFSENNPIYKEFKELYSETAVVTVCLDSIEEYGIDITGLPSNCETLDINDFALAVINTQNPVILE